jgi:hypothetical protein
VRHFCVCALGLKLMLSAAFFNISPNSRQPAALIPMSNERKTISHPISGNQSELCADEKLHHALFAIGFYFKSSCTATE